MENLLVFPAIVAFFALLLGGFLFKGRPLQGDLLDRFEGAAKTIRGTIDPGTWFRRPRLTFDASGCPAEITWTRVGQDEMSSLWLLVTVSGVPAGDLKIWSKAKPWRPRLGRPWGCPSVVIGDPAIDAEFAIRSRPAGLAERLFAPDRRANAGSLVRALAGDDAMSVTGGVLRTGYSVNRISPSGISDVASQVRKMTALLQELAR